MTQAAYERIEERAKGALDQWQYNRLRPIVRRAVSRLTETTDGFEFGELGIWAWLGVLEADVIFVG
jgi:hypothetical protein